MCNDMKRGGLKECPKNLNGWVKYFGAKYRTPKECDSIVKSNKLINDNSV